MSAQDKAKEFVAKRRTSDGTAQERAQAAVDTSKAIATSRASAAETAMVGYLNSTSVQTGLTQLIPKGMRQALTPERMLRIAVSFIRQSEALQKCTPASILGAIAQAATLGLVPDGILGHAYLIPRRIRGEMTAQFQIGYRGLVFLIYRASRIVMSARTVYRGEPWNYAEGEPFYHRPDLEHDEDENPAHMVGAYSRALFPDGRSIYRVMGMSKILKVRNATENWRYKPNAGVWHDHFRAMAEKTVLIKHTKTLPISADVMHAVLADELRAVGVRADILEQGPDGSFITTTIDTSAETASERIVEPPAPLPLQELLAAYDAMGVGRDRLARYVAPLGEPPVAPADWTDDDRGKLTAKLEELRACEPGDFQQTVADAFGE